MMRRWICAVTLGLMSACGQMEPLDGNRIVVTADAGAVFDAGTLRDAGEVKPDAASPDAGVARPADDHSNARVSGSRVSPGQGIAGVLDGESDVDWFVFTAGTGDLHRIETRGETDTKCSLYDADGRALGSNDDDGDGLNCRIDEVLTSGSDYYVMVEHFSESGTGNYTLYVEILSALTVAPEFTAQPISVAAGESIALIGSGFSALGRVGFEVARGGVQSEQLETVADESGSIETVWQTTRQTRPGSFRLVATDQLTGMTSAVVEVTVTSPPDDDHADERAGATTIRSGRATPGEVHRANDVDWFRFRTSHAGEWVISTRGDLDTLCVLMFGDEEVDSDDDDGTGLNCRIETVLQADRDYFVRVESYEADIGRYELVVIPPPVPDDHGNAIETATVLGADTSASGRLGAAGDIDVFGFTAQFTGNYRFWTIGVSDTACRLLGLRGIELASDDNSGILWNCEIERRLEAGTTYFIALRHADAEGTGSYWLFMNAPDGSPIDDHGNSLDGATLIADNGTIPGQIEVERDRDVFHFFASRDGDWIIETSSNLDTVCEVISDQDTQIDSNDDAGEDRNCRITVRLVGGTRYGVDVRLFGDGGTGAYRLRLTPP